MAEAPGHRLGQIIGDALELSIEPILQDFADEHGLYLDRKGPRSTRPGQRKCTWFDRHGNGHDLDFVLERGGTPTKVGNPAAFIETAWRRYTKHSLAKAQEIEGAVLPLLAKHANVKPFAGAVVAGRWTSGALQQLSSSGFSVLHIDYHEVVRVFAAFGVDVDAGEDTPDAYLQQQVDAWESLSGKEKADVGAALRGCAPDRFRRFHTELERVILRMVERVTVLPLHGSPLDCESGAEAVDLVRGYVTPELLPPAGRFEVTIRYTNGDLVQERFDTAADAAAFVEKFAG